MEKEFINPVAKEPQNESEQELDDKVIELQTGKATEKESKIPDEIKETLDKIDGAIESIGKEEPKKCMKRAFLSMTGGAMMLVATMTPQKAQAFDLGGIFERVGERVVTQVLNSTVSIAEKEIEKVISGKYSKKSKQPEQQKQPEQSEQSAETQNTFEEEEGK